MIMVVIVIMPMVIVMIMVMIVIVATAVMPAEIDEDCRFTIAMAVSPMSTDLDDAAADLRCLDPGTGNCIRWNSKNAAQSECR
jgi:hypothetical protein